MSAQIPTPDLRHLSLWPATGARFGDGTLKGAAPDAAPRGAGPRTDEAPKARD